MPVPDYQTLMAPVLRALVDGAARTTAQLREIAREIGLTEDDRQLTIPSGAPLFDNRVHWAVTYMKQAGLVSRPRRGIVGFADRGRDVLTKHPERVDNDVLARFVEFQDFRSRSRAAQPVETKELAGGELTPRETIAAAVEEANNFVAAELLERIREGNSAFFERIVLRVITAMGYGGAAGSAEHLGRSGDEGLDGVIRQDPLGLDRI